MQFKEQFGLDYLKGSKQPVDATRRGSFGPAGMDETLLAYGGKLIEHMKQQPDNTAKLFEAADKLKVRVDELSPVVNFLVDKGYINRVAQDKLGNDLLKLTVGGMKIPG